MLNRLQVSTFFLFVLLTACSEVRLSARPDRAQPTVQVEKQQISSPANYQPEALLLQPAQLSLALFEARKLKVLARLSNGQSVEIVNQSKLKWEFSRPGIASLLNGTLKGEAVGETDLRVSLGTLSAQLKLRVQPVGGSSPPPAVEALIVDSELYSLAPGEGIDPHARVLYADGTLNRELVWSLDRGDRVALDESSGRLTRLTAGEVRLTVFARADARIFREIRLLDPLSDAQESEAILTPPTPRRSALPASNQPELVVPRSSYLLAMGESVQIEAFLRGSDGQITRPLTFSARPAELFELSASGLLKRLKAGSGQVVISAGSQSETVTIGERGEIPTPTPLPETSALPTPLPTPTPTPTATPLPTTLRDAFGMEFRLIPAGSFIMGSPPDETGRQSNETQHTVTLTRPFYLQTTEITNAQWQAVTGQSNHSDYPANHPVQNINQDDALSLIRTLNSQNQGTYRLPTEAEWEYAARAGSSGSYPCSGNCLDSVAWHSANAGGQLQAVAQKLPNAWGLYDMLGNAYEFVQDFYGGDYGSAPQIDPTGPVLGSQIVCRGGSYSSDIPHIRLALRNPVSPYLRTTAGMNSNVISFRLVREP